MVTVCYCYLICSMLFLDNLHRSPKRLAWWRPLAHPGANRHVVRLTSSETLNAVADELVDCAKRIAQSICAASYDTVGYTSSTAQGGGGSFKNRTPIGEIGCCESGMAERSHWWTERCLRSPLFLSLSLNSYLCIYVSIYLSICLSIYLSNPI